MNESSLRKVAAGLGIKLSEEPTATGWLNGLCPFAPWTHKNGKDSHPSFGMKVEQGGISAFYCFSCKKEGRISSLVRGLAHYRNEDYGDLAMEADRADASGVSFEDFDSIKTKREERPYPLDEAEVDGLFPSYRDYPDAVAYLITRGVSVETADDLDLLFDDDPHEMRILFQVRDGKGKLFGYTGRTITGVEPKIRDYAGLKKRWFILGEDRWEAGKPVLLVEGLFGYACAIENGAEALFNVGAALGSVLNPEKADVLTAFGEPVFLMFDDDEAGEMGIFGNPGAEHKSALGRLEGKVPVHIPGWPEGKVDPDELTYEDFVEIRKTPSTKLCSTLDKRFLVD